MPQFFPSFDGEGDARGDSPDFTAFIRGYLGAAEWLHSDDMDTEGTGAQRHDKCRGWTRRAIKQARRDCWDFWRCNPSDLDSYVEESGRTMKSAGTDFFLSREGHGAGFFDRGNAPCFDRLQKAAQVYGPCSPAMMRNGYLYFMEG